MNFQNLVTNHTCSYTIIMEVLATYFAILIGTGLLCLFFHLFCCSAHKTYPLCKNCAQSIINIYIKIYMNKSLLTTNILERLFYQNIFINDNKIYIVNIDNDCSIKVYQLFVAKNISYHAGIMLNAFSDLLSLTLCWHNWLVLIF